MGYDTYHSGWFDLNKEPDEAVKEFFKTYHLPGIENESHCELWHLRSNPQGESTLANFCAHPSWFIEREENTRHGEPEDGLQFIIDNVLAPHGILVNGAIYWSGDDDDDRGKVVVKNNVITIYYAHIIYKDINGVPEPAEIENIQMAG